VVLLLLREASFRLEELEFCVIDVLDLCANFVVYSDNLPAGLGLGVVAIN
jgi:hypothetical protein